MSKATKASPDPAEAYRLSIDLLKANSTAHGFLASPIDRRNYRAVWARDGCISSVAAYISGDEELIETARRTLHTLADHQADNGQVPSYLTVDAEGNIGEVNYGGLGEVTSIDSSLWFMFACHSVFRQRGEVEFVEHPLYVKYREVIRYLLSIDANSCGLLEIPIAGDWSDILNRSYHVLYDEVLWFRALFGAAELSRDSSHDEDARYYAGAAERVWCRLNDDFWWDSAGTMRRVAEKYMIHNDLPLDSELHYYQSHLTPFLNTWSGRFDAFANVLAAVMGVAPPYRIEAIVQRVIDSGLDRPYPLRVLDPPIEESDPDAYQLRFSEEAPYDYHNGGIWPLAGGFWVALLARLGRRDEAEAALHRLAAALTLSDEDSGEWGFHEYMHGLTHEPKGTRRLSWSGAAYILAYHAHVHGEFAYFAEHGMSPVEEAREIAGNENEECSRLQAGGEDRR
jgi:glycogen debranching enzyme